MKLEVIYASFNTCWFSGTGGKPTSTRNSLWRMDCQFLAGRNARPAVKIELSSLCFTTCSRFSSLGMSNEGWSSRKRSFWVLSLFQIESSMFYKTYKCTCSHMQVPWYMKVYLSLYQLNRVVTCFEMRKYLYVRWICEVRGSCSSVYSLFAYCSQIYSCLQHVQ